MTSTIETETFEGRTLGFAIPVREARGRAVRLQSAIDTILSAHDYPAPVANLLAEALVVTVLMGSLLKQDGSQVTVQAQTEDGAVRLLACDFRGGALRGYVDFDTDRLARLGANPSLPALFGKGYLALTFDTEKQGRYQGIVPLEGDTLAEACETYFAQSEQVPTLIRTAIRHDAQGWSAAGLLVQHLPDGEEGRERLHARLDHPEWEHVSILASSIKHDELIDPALSLEAIVWRLFHEEDEVRVIGGIDVRQECRCSPEHYRDVLSRFGEDDLADMRNQEGVIEVECKFCATTLPIAI